MQRQWWGIAESLLHHIEEVIATDDIREAFASTKRGYQTFLGWLQGTPVAIPGMPGLRLCPLAAVHNLSFVLLV
jgi:hypothetical protein